MRKFIAAILLSWLGLMSMDTDVRIVAADNHDDDKRDLPGLVDKTEKREEFVYGVNAYNGTLYQGVFHPPSVDTIYLLADTINIISPRKTLIYYWAVTNEYKADFDSMNEDIPGTLEIKLKGELVLTVEPTDYVIQYPEGITRGAAEVYLGGAAQRKYGEWEEALRMYRLDVSEYYEASRNWRTDLTERVQSGKVTSEDDVLVSQPMRPADFLYSSTKVFRGVPLNLPPGEYDIQMRNDAGKIVADSVKKLVVFQSDRVGVGYTVIPEDKWTTPEQTYNPDEMLYVRSDNTLYLDPFFESEYNEQYFTHLEAPQAPNFVNFDWKWVKEENFKISDSSRWRRSEDADVTFIGERRPGPHINDEGIAYDMQVVERDMLQNPIEFEDYMVRQNPGKALGYEILEAMEGLSQGMRDRSPDFSAFQIIVRRSIQDLEVSLQGEDGAILSGSGRTVDVVRGSGSTDLFLALILPIVLGIVMVGYRRYSLKIHREKLASASIENS
ncbi:MAG: hypothetical protein ACJ0HE_00795 [Anaerolineales bacterium]